MAGKSIDSQETRVGQVQEHIIPPIGHVHREDLVDIIEVQDTPRWKDKAKALAFDDEPVTVVISSDSDPNAEQIIDLACNGVSQRLFRNEQKTIKRKFVEILARAKKEIITTPQITDASGNQTTKIVRTPGLRYPFRVLKDNNPDGPVWLERVLAEV